MIIADIEMKRDMDLIRLILLGVESHPSGFTPKLEIPDYTQEQIGYHTTLMAEAGLVIIEDVAGFGGKSPRARIVRLTWQGHEFLDAARENQTWNQAKDLIGKIGGASLQIWITLLTELIKKKLGL